MSTNQQIRDATRKCTNLLRLVGEARQSEDTAHAQRLYRLAKAECDNIEQMLNKLLTDQRPADQIRRHKAA